MAKSSQARDNVMKQQFSSDLIWDRPVCAYCDERLKLAKRGKTWDISAEVKPVHFKCSDRETQE